MLDFFDTYLYRTLHIQKAHDNQCSNCKQEVYSFYPDNLIVADNFFNKTSGTLTSTHDDVLLAPEYYVSGSKIRIFVEFYASVGKNVTAKLVAFNNLRQYDAFRRGEQPKPYQTSSVYVSKNKEVFSSELTVSDTGYYFIGIRPTNGPVTFQSTFIVHQIYYSRVDFPRPTCELDSTATGSCTIHFPPSSTDTYTDTLKMCVLVYSEPPQEVPTSYYVTLDYSVYRGFWTSRSTALLTLIGICCFFCVCSLCLFFFTCARNIIQARRIKIYR